MGLYMGWVFFLLKGLVKNSIHLIFWQTSGSMFPLPQGNHKCVVMHHQSHNLCKYRPNLLSVTYLRSFIEDWNWDKRKYSFSIPSPKKWWQTCKKFVWFPQNIQQKNNNLDILHQEMIDLYTIIDKPHFISWF